MGWTTRYYPLNGLDGNSLWKDVDKFREPAMRFLKDGTYCTYPSGTYAYKEFWDIEEDRLKNGITVDGQKISGLHYMYLNYCPIYNKKKKLFTFPDFWDLDADWFLQIDKAKKVGRHLAALKARQKGFSLKDAVPIIHNLHFHRKSMNYLGSFYEKYATKTWVFTKDYLSHINKFTDFYKNRLPDTASYLRMAFEEIIDGKKVESGYLSELHKLTFKDRAESSVGGAIDLSVIEEAGVFPNLLDVLEFMKPATMDGSFTTGLIIAYGSVGDLDKCEGLKKIFYEPEANDFMAYDNIWDDVEIAKNKKCGYFVPEYICLKPYIDDNGNSDIDSSLKYLDGERAKQKKKSVRQYLTYISQHPIKPQEAFLSKSVNKFPVELLTKWLAELETVGSIGNVGYGLELLNDKGVVKPKILGISSPYEKYPIEQTDDGIEGSIWIYEPPSPEKQTGLYIAMVDSVDQDAAPTSSSIFSLTIYKRTNNNALDQTDRKIVATYNGRRPTAEEMYDIAINLCEYYNAKLLVENANVGIVNHFRNKNKEYILQEQMDEIKGLNPTSKVSRSYGFHPTREVILNGDNLIIKYLTEVIGYIYTDDTKTTIAKEILGYTRIKDKGLIRELIAYNDEDNFDRITSFRGCLLYEQALYQRRVIKEESVNSPMSAAAKLADKFLIGARMVRMGLKNKNF